MDEEAKGILRELVKNFHSVRVMREERDSIVSDWMFNIEKILLNIQEQLRQDTGKRAEEEFRKFIDTANKDNINEHMKK